MKVRDAHAYFPERKHDSPLFTQWKEERNIWKHTQLKDDS